MADGGGGEGAAWGHPPRRAHPRTLSRWRAANTWRATSGAAAADRARRSTSTASTRWRADWPDCANAAGGCSSSAWAAAPGHASHAVNDFRKLCRIESYAPTDNVSELTARTNDDGWDTSFTEWLAVSRLSAADGLMVFSVGGGSRAHNVSINLVNAIELARERGALDLRCGRVSRRHSRAAGRSSDRRDGAPRAQDAAGGGLSGGRLACARVPSGPGRAARALGVAERRATGSDGRLRSSSTATA